ncbi:pyruvate, phosphate dikinase [Alphaproteobacteria bacterium]|nr:pyruvate, phosphate dikinase [Alphaproteobacteria bacterium]
MSKWVYSFGQSLTEGSASDRNLLGGKGANLAEMSSIGLPVPPGFTLSTEICTWFYDNGRSYPSELKDQVNAAIARLEQETGMGFANPENPLLLSVRSGARASMPGMMDTVLNLGLNRATAEGLAKRSGEKRFAWDSFRRFIQMYSDVVMDVDHGLFEDALEDMKAVRGYVEDTDLSGDDFETLVEQYLAIVQEESGEAFPEDPHEQLWGAIGAVFGSWMNARAMTYRRLNNIPAEWGTAVNIQAMVFGNMGDDCATGVAFTRNPSTGANVFYGEFLINAQGEDVVAGIRTPRNLTKREREESGSDQLSMEEAMPEVFTQLCDVRQKLETHYRDMQDIEFTIQQDKLYMLQTRSGKRTAEAALRMAVEMAEEGLITRDEAILRVNASSLDQLLHPTLDPKADKTMFLRGLPASPGAASGKVVLTADKAEEMALAGHNVILARVETSPEDIHGMHAATGILTARGGMTSHAAVVARGMGRPCVCGAGEMIVDAEEGVIKVGPHKIKEGDIITLDGGVGEVYLGEVATIQPQLSGVFGTLIGWADEVRRMKIRANAETPLDAKMALDFGAEGIGLSRTEHMFFDSDRIVAMREMIIANDTEGRQKALDKLLPMQRQDFIALFEIMKGLPVTIRLLDPPLHEFLPHHHDDMAEVAKQSGVSLEEVRDRSAKLRELNPMLGHRGCRLAITYPEICAMQARAIFEAATHITKETGEKVDVEVMIPLAATRRELEICRKIIDDTAEIVKTETGQPLTYMVGTMVELPRSSLIADDLAVEAEFFSFGTNDLTQTALGISRDDAGQFLREYADAGIYPRDPFITIDVEGVGALVQMGCDKGRQQRPGIKLGVCGEHGGDPDSVDFFEECGLDYVSCSPYRVPVARLAAAQATIRRR